MRADLVSVIVPCYNAAAYVGATLESVLAQTHPAIELVVVDDASTDESWAVIERYATPPGEGARIPVTAIRLPENRKGSHARNRGAERARGAFLMFLDADDVLGAPETIGALVAAVRDVPEAIGIVPWRRLVPDGTANGRWQWKAGPPKVPLPRDEDDHLAGWLEGRWVPPCAVLWRRDVYERTGGWDEALTGDDDADITMRALASGARLVRSSGGEALYRTHPPTTSPSVSGNVGSPTNLLSRLRVLEKLEALLRAQGRLERYAASIGVGYYRLVPLASAHHPEIAAECVRRGKRLAGRRAVSGTLHGRVIAWLFGMDGKERIIAALARVGIASRERRRMAAVRKGS